jgi:hypothetical protein
MISITSTTKNYILQPGLIKNHKKTLSWLSSLMMWESEITFFQKSLEENAVFLTKLSDKKRVDHFQNLFTFYNGEVIDELRSKLIKHESSLASSLKTKNETNTKYFEEHDSLMDELESFSKSYKELKKDFLKFIKK